MRKRQRTEVDMHPGNVAPVDPSIHPGGPPVEDAFINDHDAAESGGDDDDDDEKPKGEKKAGRRKIKIEFIQDKSRRHITFSKRKAGMFAFTVATTPSPADHMSLSCRHHEKGMHTLIYAVNPALTALRP